MADQTPAVDLSPDALAAWQAAAEQATPGPWEAHGYTVTANTRTVEGVPHFRLVDTYGGSWSENAAYIALCSPEKVRAVIAEVARLRARLSDADGDTWKSRAEYAEGRMAEQASELARLRAEPWRPIESAPKDGTRIIVWNGARRRIVYWDRALHWEDDEGNSLWAHAVVPPTHWMPLPAPPPDAGTEKETK